MSEKREEAVAVVAEPVPAALAGKSYWDIVAGQFRKNRPAVRALVLILGIYTISVATPWLANDPPIYLRGTMPGIYQRMFSEYRFGAHAEFMAMPGDLENTRTRWHERKVSMKEFRKSLVVEDWHRFGAAIEREKDRVRLEMPNDFKWKTDAVEIGVVRERLPPAEQSLIDASIARIEGELGVKYAERLQTTLTALEVKLVAMADQLGPEHVEKAARAAAAYRMVAEAGWLRKDAEARKPEQARLEAVLKDTAETFDPAHVDLKLRTYWPVLASLGTLDALFMSTTVSLLVVIPLLLTFTPLGKVSPRARRVEICFFILLTIVVPLTLWRGFQRNYFESISFKAAIRDGAIIPEGRVVAEDGTVVSEGAIVHTPFYFGMNEQDTAHKFEPPKGEHWFGTDEIGRDLLTRVLWGSRISLAVGFVSTGIALSIGIVLGALAGYFRLTTDVVISRLIEIILCFPFFFIILAVMAVLPPSIYKVMIVLGLFGWTGIARLTRAEFLRLVDQDFVTAGRALGASHFRLIFRHVLPNSLGPILVAASFSVASAILTESALSFLGFGVSPPDTSWGQILSTARDHPTYYWLVLIPGFAIFITVTLYNLLGEGIRDAIDPRMRI